jgi:biotin transport system substrate-specific component
MKNSNFTHSIWQDIKISVASVAKHLDNHEHKSLIKNFIYLFCGVVALSLSARIALKIPGTVVPFTLQTFMAIFLAALARNKRLWILLFSSYLFLAYLGAPILSMGQILQFNSSFGYLIGMLIGGTFLVQSTKRWISIIYFHVCVYIFGLAHLYFFLNSSMDLMKLLALGVLPFIIGDLFKSLLAVSTLKMISSFEKKLWQ